MPKTTDFLLRAYLEFTFECTGKANQSLSAQLGNVTNHKSQNQTPPIAPDQNIIGSYRLPDKNCMSAQTMTNIRLPEYS